MNRLNRTHRRELERELRDLPTPPAPPAGLLDRIREEIPADLGTDAAHRASGARRPWHATAGFRLAATIAIATVGVALAYRTLNRPAGDAEGEAAPPPPAQAESRSAFQETSPRVVAESEAVVAPEAKDEKLSDRGLTPGRPRVEESTVTPFEGEADSRLDLATGAAPAPTPSSMESLGQGRRQTVEAGEEVAGSAAAVAAAADAELRRANEAPAPRETATAAPAAPAGPSAQTARGAEPERARAEMGSRLAKKRVAGEADAAAPSGGSEEQLRSLGYVGGRAPAAAPSTGGSAEPLDRPVGDMFFRPTGVNPFVDSAEDRLSTFALDVDTGSYTLARSYLERGSLPPAEAIRVEEFVNAQRYEDPAPRRGEFTLTAEGAPSPFAPGERYRLLRFAVRARDVAAWQRKPAVLTFVVDVSGSMDRENRLGLVQRALGLLLDELAPEDRVGLVVYGSNGRVLLPHTRDLEAIRDAVARLVPEGSTNAEEGLRLGYDLADRGYRAGAINRLILCSDGVANVGATGPESILARIGREARRGIELTAVGFGMGNYNDALMEQLADQGDGAYHYVDTLDEARKVFVENLTGTLQTVAKDAKVQVEFEPAAVDRWRLLGYENRDVADRDFRNDRVDAGEVGVGTAVTALYEVRLAPGATGADRLATLRLRWKSVDGGRVAEAHQDLAVADLGRSFAGASRDLRVAAVAAELAERLKQSFYAREGGWHDLVAEARELARDFRREREVADLATLVERAARLAGTPPERGDDEPRRPEEDPERER